MLNTKLNRPTLSNDLLHRTYLVEKLEKSSHLPLILLSAPAGYGKSVLVSQWLNYYQKDYSWLSLDESMNDTSIFISYLIDTLERSGDSKKIQKIFKNKQEIYFLTWDAIINRIINSVNEIQENLRLVLDDYHLIKNLEIHQLVKALIKENLDNLQVVIITRWDPPFQLKELRLYNRMLELRMRELRFEKSEIYQFLSSAKDIRFSDSEIDLFLENTEGWILAIRMYLMAKSFSNSNNEKELLNQDLDRLMFHISENIDQKFFKTMQLCSLFDQFDKELINAVCRCAYPDSCSAETFLSKLIELNFFLIPIRGAHEKFRFHHLIGNILKRQLEGTEPALVNSIYNDMSVWFSDNGFADEAIQYSIQAKNYTLTCKLIKTHREVFLEKGEWWVLQRWIKNIPRQIRNAHIDILLTELIICEETWNLVDFSSILEVLDALGIENSNPKNLSQYLHHLGYYFTFVSPNPKKAAESLERSISLCHDESYMLSGRSELILACSKQMQGLTILALKSLEDFQGKSEPFSKTHIRAVHGKVFIHILSGNFESAINEAKRLQFLVQDTGLRSLEGWSFYFQGNVAFQCYNEPEAMSELKGAVKFKGLFNLRTYFDALAGLIILSSLKGNEKATESFLLEMSQMAINMIDPKFQYYFDSVKARLSWHHGQGEKELDWALQDWVKVRTGNYLFLIDVPELTKLRIIVSHGSIQLVTEAIEVIETLETSLNEIYNKYHIVDITLLKAIAEYRIGNAESAEKFLEKALLLAESAEISRPIFEVYQVMPELFNLVNTSSKSYHALVRLGLIKSTAKYNPENLNLKELTIREQEIVKLIAIGLRNKEIADQLHISTVTVKSHLTNIYRKLDVYNRTSMLRIIQNQ
ncbi:hypothetical protein JYB62_18680 [Algoriphagus lutimaris]|uniref:LuxR C-terminal-related transcriptional regulator n=1 Tax=Algoriphagus lutimaris TaxID=613197 RepID=UPI00196B6B15|nr:LuxR C-terminal-related transcriptional regulator [Algoriphagus lutimaris]MBN3522037.1 hypothetical protein [Algoriphagus lutimaris]